MAMELPFEGELPAGTRAASVADRDVPTCALGDNVGDVADRMGGAEVCVVVEDGLVMGLLSGDALDGRSTTAADAMAPGPSTFRPPVPKDELAHFLDEHDLARTLLTTLDGRLVGLVRREDLD